MNRRDFLAATAAVGAAALMRGCTPKPQPTATPGQSLITAAERYDAGLVQTILDGLAEFPDLTIRGKSVLLKPNLVETTSTDRPINTHPAVVAAAVEAFRKLGASRVIVGDGPGHRRDIEQVLAESGLGQALDEVDAEFVDLNHDSVFTANNAGGRTRLKQLFLPATLKECDVVVSLAKLKTHHWAGVTLTMKNLFGLMPGIVYGWPKNILHRAGKLQQNSIPHCIVDIAQTVRPAFGIVDGIVGMEGDGPIMGNARPVGCLIMGDMLASVDATAAAIMGLQPHKVPYLVDADRSGLGGTNPSIVAQRGETIARFRQSFAVPPTEEWSDLAQA